VRIRYLGGGTERVEQELRVRFPQLRTVRLDRDVVERKGAAARVIDDFTAGAADVLVGTSLVAKGLDIPEVTVVGVVSSDIALNLPDERAAERTWQLRRSSAGRVVAVVRAWPSCRPTSPSTRPSWPWPAAIPRASWRKSSRGVDASARHPSGGSSS
jgi:hypothetical protein